ncbi:M14 family metallopeptidase [Amycolatopsis magusensis]|uniref:Peptidase M14 domain-containing protein n=1 Tax=Amycolatopsis magusensis TaxID=882444 RepID=A0ABS4PK82_9PSEU|nr:hypothetical protein [Amycolatopsis magusensis]
MRKRRSVAAALSAAALIATAVAASPSVGAAPDTAAAEAATQTDFYEVLGTNSPQLRTKVSATGVDVVTAGETTTIIGTGSEAQKLRGLGFQVEKRPGFEQYRANRAADVTTAAADFPAGDENYHTYAEVVAELQQTVTDHGNLVKLGSIGTSYQGRNLPVIKISDNAGTDEAEPEVLFTCNQHAREHLTTEMCLHIVKRFTDKYTTDTNVKNLVDTKEIWVIPTVNPDGSEYDIAGGSYKMWRKNRQGQGTDPNRNWGHKWGCCGGSSGSPGSETYRGTAAFSAPEVKAVADWVGTRRVGGVQQIKSHIDFHTYSELVLWPFGYTYADTAPGMTAAEAQKFKTLGQQMAATNGYTPQQASDLYITDGSVDDWMWYAHKILSYTFEMYPKGSNPGFYPPDEVIPAQTARNDKAVDILINASL